MARWRGILYVERGRPGVDWDQRAELWEDCCLTARPFLFSGDRALLASVHTALTALAQVIDPFTPSTA